MRMSQILNEVKAEAETFEQKNEHRVKPEHKADESVIDLDDTASPESR